MRSAQSGIARRRETRFRVLVGVGFELGGGGGGEREERILKDGGCLSLVRREELGCNLRRGLGVKLEERKSFEGFGD